MDLGRLDTAQAVLDITIHRPWAQQCNGSGSTFPSVACLTASFPPLQSGLKRLQNSCIAAIRRGPVPQHIAIIMDGNRRFARSNRIDTAEGHYSGAETLKNVCPPSATTIPLHNCYGGLGTGVLG